MEVITKKLADQKGEVAVRGAVILLIATILFMAALETIHIYHTVLDVKSKTSEAVLATASLNVAGIYQGVRESKWYARQYDDPSWSANVDATQVIYQLATATGGQIVDDDSVLKEDSYQISDLQTTHDNAVGDGLNFTTMLHLDIFLNIGGILNAAIPIDLEVHTTYATKF